MFSTTQSLLSAKKWSAGDIMKIEVVQARGLTIIGRGSESSSWVVMDGPYSFRGSSSGTRPMELFLISLGGCTGMDVISLMDKMKVPYRKLKITIDYERAEEHPKVYTKINLHYIIYGDIKEEKDRANIEKAIRLSQERYCSVSAMVRSAGIELNYDWETKDQKEADMPEEFTDTD